MENVIIQTAFLGDLFLSIPLIRRLREIDSDRELALVCRKGLGQFFIDARLVDRVVEVDKKDPKLWRQQQRELQQTVFANIICPHESFRTALLVAGMKADGAKIGFYKRWNFWAFNKRVHRPLFLPDALRQLSLLTALDAQFAEEFSAVAATEGLQNAAAQSPALIDFRTSEIPEWAKMKVSPLAAQSGVSSEGDGRTPTIFLAPGSVWNTKRWTLEGYSQVARTLVHRGYNVVVTGSQAEHELGEEIRKHVPQVINLSGQMSITQTIDLYRRGMALISNDSGAMHLASAAGLPTVAIFGPTTLDIGYRPWQQQAMVVQSSLKCRPCGKHGADVCPLGTHECMTAVTPDSVLSALGQLTRAL